MFICSCRKNDEDYLLVINFFGCIDPEYTSHELRGLNIIVRLCKSVPLPWPRLTKDTEKKRWLTYNYNFIRLDDKQLRTLSKTHKFNLCFKSTNLFFFFFLGNLKEDRTASSSSPTDDNYDSDLDCGFEDNSDEEEF